MLPVGDEDEGVGVLEQLLQIVLEEGELRHRAQVAQAERGRVGDLDEERLVEGRAARGARRVLRSTTPKSWLPTPRGTATEWTLPTQQGTSSSTSRRPPDWSAASERPPWRTASPRSDTGGGPPSTIGALASRDTWASVFGSTSRMQWARPGKSEARAWASTAATSSWAWDCASPRVRSRSARASAGSGSGAGGPRTREPRGVGLDGPPDHLAGPEQCLERLAAAGARLATDRAREGGVGPDDAPPHDQRGREREALEGGGEGGVHRRSPRRAEGGERGGHDLADRHAVRRGAGQAVLVLGVRPTATPPRRATFTRTSP